MKIKQALYIHSPDAFLKGQRDSVFHLTGRKVSADYMPSHWVKAGDVEFDVDISREEITRQMLGALDLAEEEARKEAAEKLEDIARQRQELQALTYNPEVDQ